MLLLATTVVFFLACSSLAFASYDQSASQFSPDGNVRQIEYAKEFVNSRGGAIIAVRGEDGVIIACHTSSIASKGVKCSEENENLILVDDVDEGSNSKTAASAGQKKTKSAIGVATFDKNEEYVIGSGDSVDVKKTHILDHGNIFLAATGISGDAQAVVEAAKKICQRHMKTYDCPIPPESLCDELASLLHAQTRASGARPLGVGLVVGGYDEILGSQLFTIDPEGSFACHRACCIGGGKSFSSKVMEILGGLYDGRKQSPSVLTRVKDIWRNTNIELQKMTEIKGWTFSVHEGLINFNPDEIASKNNMYWNLLK